MRPLLLSIFLLGLSLSAETLSWRSDYEQAHKEALAAKKGLLVKEDCPLCIKMLSTTLKDQPYGHF